MRYRSQTTGVVSATIPRAVSRHTMSIGHLLHACCGVVSNAAGDKVFSPLPVALVEGRRRAQPGTPDTLGARKAKVLHQVNQALAQSKIRRRPVDRFYACHFDLRQDRCRSFGRPHRRRLLRLCCKRPCRSHASEQADEIASFHSTTSSARASSVGGRLMPSTCAVLRLTTNSKCVGNWSGMSAGRAPRKTRATKSAVLSPLAL